MLLCCVDVEWPLSAHSGCAAVKSIHSWRFILPPAPTRASSCYITLILISPLSHTPIPFLLHHLGAYGDSQRGHGDGGNSLTRGTQLLLHQPGCWHRLHCAVHHPHRGSHHRLAAPRRRLGAVTPRSVRQMGNHGIH